MARKKNKVDMTISEQLDVITDAICKTRCKYFDTWDEEAEGCELSESEHCQNCPINEL